jgi:hypothetical protein
MSLKIHFLHLRFDSFAINCGAIIDKHGEHFHQDIWVMGSRQKSKWIAAILASYCCTVKRSTPEIQYKWQARMCLF